MIRLIARARGGVVLIESCAQSQMQITTGNRALSKMEKIKFPRKLSAPFRALKKKLSFTGNECKGGDRTTSEDTHIKEPTAEIMEEFMFETLLGSKSLLN